MAGKIILFVAVMTIIAHLSSAEDLDIADVMELTLTKFMDYTAAFSEMTKTPDKKVNFFKKRIFVTTI